MRNSCEELIVPAVYLASLESRLKQPSRHNIHRTTCQLGSYARQRNNALFDGVSRMSAYLHYGMVSPFRIASEAAQFDHAGSEKYLDELLLWRELAYSFCFHRGDQDQWSAKGAFLHGSFLSWAARNGTKPGRQQSGDQLIIHATPEGTSNNWNENPDSAGCFADDCAIILCCGDWTYGSRVEGAFLSGAAAAGRVLGSLRPATPWPAMQLTLF